MKKINILLILSLFITGYFVITTINRNNSFKRDLERDLDSFISRFSFQVPGLNPPPLGGQLSALTCYK